MAHSYEVTQKVIETAREYKSMHSKIDTGADTLTIWMQVQRNKRRAYNAQVYDNPAHINPSRVKTEIEQIEDLQYGIKAMSEKLERILSMRGYTTK